MKNKRSDLEENQYLGASPVYLGSTLERAAHNAIVFSYIIIKIFYLICNVLLTRNYLL